MPGLFVGLLLEGFYVAPRGMGAIPAIATTSDVDDLAAAIGRVLRVALSSRPAAPRPRWLPPDYGDQSGGSSVSGGTSTPTSVRRHQAPVSRRSRRVVNS